MIKYLHILAHLIVTAVWKHSFIADENSEAQIGRNMAQMYKDRKKQNLNLVLWIRNPYFFHCQFVKSHLDTRERGFYTK